jgi:integrase
MAQDALLLADLLTLVQQDLELNERAYRKNFRWQIKPLLAELGNTPAASIDYPTLESYKLKRLKDGAARKTVNIELSAIQRAFSIGIDAGMISTKPKIRRLHVNNARKGFVEPNLLEEILRNLRSQDLRDYVEFAYWTGWRRGEVRKLIWEDVDAEFVYCPGENNVKNKDGKKASLDGAVGEVISRRRLKRSFRTDLVFHWRAGRAIRDFSVAWVRAVATVGKPDLHFHDLRRSFVRNCIRAGIPERIAMELSGHRTRSVFDRYNIVDEEDLKHAAGALQEWRKTRSG